MDKGIYTALSGGLAKSHELELIANNLANANTPGFKRDTGTFNEYLTELRRPDSVEGLKRDINAETLLDGRPSGDKSFVEMDGIYTDFRPGTLQPTGRHLDVGIEGKGFLEVLTPSGVRYTRAGGLSVSQDGQLVNSSGFPVLASEVAGELPAGNGLPNQLPAPEGRIIHLQNSAVQISPEGNVAQNGRSVAKLSIQEFQEPQWLEKVGSTLYRNTHPDNLATQGGTTRLHQGFLESSNVNAVHEMTRLIEATRAYESHMQAVKTFQEIDSKTVNDIAK